MRREAAACRAVAAVAALHACSILCLLRSDSEQPPFTALLTEDQLQLRSREVVVLHHKRLTELNSTLTHLSRVADADRLRLTVVQSLGTAEAAAADATAALLHALVPQLGLNVRHRPAVQDAELTDGTYSVDARRYGTKRNSFRNLLNGLDAVFALQLGLRSAIVLEDDTLLATDTLDYFDMAASLLASAERLALPERPVLAATVCFLRDSHEDYRWWHHRAARRFGGGANRYRREQFRAATLKTNAWLVSREVYEAMRRDVLTGPEPMLALRADAPLHSSLAGCSYCENFCYDHYLEWRWRDASYVCPAVPRARAEFSGGMTERTGTLASADSEWHHARRRAGDELNERRTHRWEFVDDVTRRAAARSLHSLVCWLVPAMLLLCGWTRPWRGRDLSRLCPSAHAPRKAKHEDGDGGGLPAAWGGHGRWR